MKKNKVIIIIVLVFVFVFVIFSYQLGKLNKKIDEQQILSQYIMESSNVHIGVIVKATKKYNLDFADDYWIYIIYDDKNEYELEIEGYMPQFKVGNKVIVFYDSFTNKYSDPILYDE